MPSGGAMARNKPEGTYTTGEVAAKVGKAPSTVRRWCQEGHLPALPVVYGTMTVYYVRTSDMKKARALAASRALIQNRKPQKTTSDKD